MVIQKGIRQNDFNFLDGVLQKLSTSHGGRWYVILNMKYRVIHISNEFEDFTGYSLSDYRERGLHLVFAQSAAEELIQAMSKQLDIEVQNLALSTKDGYTNEDNRIINTDDLQARRVA